MCRKGLEGLVGDNPVEVRIFSAALCDYCKDGSKPTVNGRYFFANSVLMSWPLRKTRTTFMELKCFCTGKQNTDI